MREIWINIVMSIVFIVPGVIIISITERIMPKTKKEYNLKFLDFFIYSFVNASIWGIPSYTIFLNMSWWKERYILLWIVFILCTIISPIAISLIIIVINKNEILRKICNYFEINLIENEPSAWDYKFSKMESEWVIVTLKDNNIIAGFMGGLSCASSNQNERDLYINEVYRIDDNNVWHRVDYTQGILIKQENIKYIEFFEKGSSVNENK